MRDQILASIRRLAEANNGQPPGREIFERETGIRPATWLGVYWARWGDALNEAGYRANTFQGKVDEAHLLQRLAEAVRHYGKVPTSAELRMFGSGKSDYPTHSTFTNRFRSKSEMLRRLHEWAEASDEYADVAKLILTQPRIRDRAAPAGKEGLVYLIKSGSHYKIGRSDELERRVKEIRVALPEAATIVHAIRTDDPTGIEAYWHRRFSDRRANGEWFRLTTADVAAFKPRKFQ